MLCTSSRQVSTEICSSGKSSGREDATSNKLRVREKERAPRHSARASVLLSCMSVLAGAMPVTSICYCCCKISFSAISPSTLFPRCARHLPAFPSPPQSRFQSFLYSSPAYSNRQRSWHQGLLSSECGWASLDSHGKRGAHFTSSSRHFGKIVSSRRNSRRARVRSAAGEAAVGRVVDGDSTSKCLYLKRTVGNGEIVEHSGTVLICGDVEHEGHVLAAGDVIVLGRLRGRVHAGRAAGAAGSRIFATVMEPKEIQICDSPLFCPNSDHAHVPKVASLASDGTIRIFPAAEAVAEQTRAVTSQKLQIHQNDRNQRPAQVALVTGIYVSVAGLALLCFPKVFFGILFDLQGVRLGWVRVGAILAVVFGVYYIGTAVGDMRGMNGAEAFYLSTVVGRTFLFLSFSWLVLTGTVPRPLLLVGTVNLVGAIVMLKAVLRPPA